MGLRGAAYLEIEPGMGGASGTGVFELREALDRTDEVNRKLLIGNRGQYLSAVYDIGADLIPDELADLDPQRRSGYSIDEGMGVWSFTLSAEYSIAETEHWGDGSAPTDDYNAFDVDSADSVVVAQDVLENWLANSNTDSRAQALLHVGEFTDGSYSDDGLFAPVVVSVDSVTVSNEHDQPGVFEFTLEMTRTSEFPVTFGGVGDVIDSTTDKIAEAVPDFA